MTNQKAIKVIEHIVDSKCLAIGNFTLFEEEKEAMRMAIEALKEEPREKAKWELFWGSYLKCSSCGNCTDIHTPYCAWCGAEMEERKMTDREAIDMLLANYDNYSEKFKEIVDKAVEAKEREK